MEPQDARPDLEIFVFVGSFRSGSLNQAVLATLRDLAPPDVAIGDFDLRTVPFYDGDLEKDGPPSAVLELNRFVREADGVLFITPEYNGGLPAVLKNAIDWTSRGYPEAPISRKLAATLGASPGRNGTASAQEHLRKILGRVGAVVLDEPPVRLSRAGELVSDGQIVDPEARAETEALLDKFLAAVRLARSCGSLSAAS